MFGKNSIVSLSLTLPQRSGKVTDNLILNGIKICHSDELYSEIEEQNYFLLNSNDYGFGRVDFELLFEPIKEPYCQFWAGCISIRTNSKAIKINPSLSSYKMKPEQSLTKISHENKMSVTLSYFFTSAEEREELLNSKLFLIEGFLALKNKNNVYGFLCKIGKEDNEWTFSEGYTNRPNKKESIESYVH